MRPVMSGLPATTPADVHHPPYEEILALTCRAPSVHNTQPWLWRLQGERLDLLADVSRQLVHADPDGRDLLLSCGAVLQHLQVVAAGFGWSARVRRLPNPAQPRLLAAIRFSPSARSAHAAAALRAVATRQTDRRRFTSWPVPAERLHSLAATGSQWGAQVLPVGGESVRTQLRRLTTQADRIQRQDRGYLHELEAWVRAGRDGLVAGALPSHDSPVGPANTVNRRFPPGTLADPPARVEASGDGMLLVCTSADDPISRVRAGEAMSAVWLRATEEHLAVVPLSQAVEVDQTRSEIRQAILGNLAHPQILMRVGWLPVARSEAPRTPRRDLSEVLVRVRQ